MKFNKFSVLFAALTLSCGLTACSSSGSVKTEIDENEAVSSRFQNITPDVAIDLLKQGNIKYLSNNSDSDLREDLFENGQHPYAVVITCSDSRVIPEESFSANFGELFTIRTAGNVVS